MNLDDYYERLRESQFARNENIRIQECHECNGAGQIPFSECCDVEVVDGICQDVECLKPCTVYTQICDQCNGDGTIEIETNQQQDENESRRDAEFE